MAGEIENKGVIGLDTAGQDAQSLNHIDMGGLILSGPVIGHQVHIFGFESSHLDQGLTESLHISHTKAELANIVAIVVDADQQGPFLGCRQMGRKAEEER